MSLQGNYLFCFHIVTSASSTFSSPSPTFDRFCVKQTETRLLTEDMRKKKSALKGRWQRQQKEIYCEQAGRGRHGTGASHSHLLSTYPRSHQSAGPLEHLSPVAFLRPVKPSHFTDDRLMCLHELRPPRMQGPGEDRDAPQEGLWSAD